MKRQHAEGDAINPGQFAWNDMLKEMQDEVAARCTWLTRLDLALCSRVLYKRYGLPEAERNIYLLVQRHLEARPTFAQQRAFLVTFAFPPIRRDGLLLPADKEKLTIIHWVNHVLWDPYRTGPLAAFLRVHIQMDDKLSERLVFACRTNPPRVFLEQITRVGTFALNPNNGTFTRQHIEEALTRGSDHVLAYVLREKPDWLALGPTSAELLFKSVNVWWQPSHARIVPFFQDLDRVLPGQNFLSTLHAVFLERYVLPSTREDDELWKWRYQTLPSHAIEILDERWLIPLLTRGDLPWFLEHFTLPPERTCCFRVSDTFVAEVLTVENLEILERIFKPAWNARLDDNVEGELVIDPPDTDRNLLRYAFALINYGGKFTNPYPVIDWLLAHGATLSTDMLEDAAGCAHWSDYENGPCKPDALRWLLEHDCPLDLDLSSAKLLDVILNLSPHVAARLSAALDGLKH